jgi:hypothetical protein
MNDVTKVNSNALMTGDLAARLMRGIAESRSTTVIVGGKPMLRLLRDGGWVYGQTNDEVEEGSRWAINPMTLEHGWVCWVPGVGKDKNTLAGEVMTSMLEPKDPCPPPIHDTEYKDQRQFDLKCMDGEAAGVEVVHKVTSVGGMRAVDGLLAAIQTQLRNDPAHPCPVVVLESETYNHNKWGKIYNPIYRVTGWVDMQGNAVEPALFTAAKETVAARAEPFPFDSRDKAPLCFDDPARGAPDDSDWDSPSPPASKPRGRPRQAPPPPEPVPTPQLHTGQRRRPVAPR